MKTILITGPIGSGKSAVCDYIASKGYPVYDCDSRTKLLYQNSPGLSTRIETELGLKMTQLAKIFSDDNLRERLEAIVYPELLKDICEWKQSLNSDYAFIESAIAMDKKQFDAQYEGVLLVRADYNTRLGRNPKVAQRDALQTFDEKKVNFIINNNSSLSALYAEVDQLLIQLKNSL